MSPSRKPKVGSISWVDLTVDNADQVRNFYKAVVGWESTEVEMQGYSDYCMNTPESGNTVAGICHARGPNADLPSAWLLYITVQDLRKSISRCNRLGGTVISGIKDLGPQGCYCVIRDPAGAVVALFSPRKEDKPKVSAVKRRNKK
jgi:predicted enzyme related to lactoylglutathione lyase